MASVSARFPAKMTKIVRVKVCALRKNVLHRIVMRQLARREVCVLMVTVSMTNANRPIVPTMKSVVPSMASASRSVLCANRDNVVSTASVKSIPVLRSNVQPVKVVSKGSVFKTFVAAKTSSANLTDNVQQEPVATRSVWVCNANRARPVSKGNASRPNLWTKKSPLTKTTRKPHLMQEKTAPETAAVKNQRAKGTDKVANFPNRLEVVVIARVSPLPSFPASVFCCL